ncbi:hypothetical protein D1007_44497 [Hordeum vulgare]|nr:hypothetical protein D1007_44497 [Hordeum vulgare]
MSKSPASHPCQEDGRGRRQGHQADRLASPARCPSCHGATDHHRSSASLMRQHKAEVSIHLDQPEDLDDSEDNNYVPPIKEDEILRDEDFIVPEDPLDQELFRQHLIATPRRLQIKQRQVKAEKDTINERWTKVLAVEEGYREER